MNRLRAPGFGLLALLTSACASSSPTAPLPNPGTERKLPPPSEIDIPARELPRPEPAGLRIVGPSGCVDASSQPSVMVWTITGVPDDAVLEKAYSFDDTPDCHATEQALRTQNDHLRWTRFASGGLRVEFDRDTHQCYGQSQIDLGIKGGRLLIHMVLTYLNRPRCQPEPPVIIPPPVPPPAPSCLPPNPTRHDIEKCLGRERL